MEEKELARYIELYHGTIYRLAYSCLKNRADADDICSEVFFRLYRYKGSFEADENCKAWLIRVAVNLARNQLKSAWRTRRTELDENIPEEVKHDSDLYGQVMQLPPKYRLVIHLYYYEGYSGKEIARITGTPVSTVTTQLARARKQLKEAILKEGLQ